MKTDSLKKYVELRDSLMAEKAKLEKRLNQINEALGAAPVVEAAPKKSAEPKAPAGEKRGRVRNAISLRAAVAQVTKDEPLTKAQILVAVKKLGYKFGATNPIPSLNTVLYTKPKFKNVDSKFSPPSE